jgi:hypothetical protein
VFENRTLRRTMDPKMDKIMGGWRKLHHTELDNLCPSPYTIKLIRPERMRWAEHIVRMAEERNDTEFGGKARREETTRKHIHRWEDIQNMDLREIRCDNINWIHLAQERDQWRTPVKMVMNLRVP